MRAPLSGSTVSGDGTGDGSHDGSTHDGDSDEVCAPSRRATGLRSAQQCKKRKIPDEVKPHHSLHASPTQIMRGCLWQGCPQQA